MSSLMKMFKTNKKNNNKENVPQARENTLPLNMNSSFRSTKRGDQIYVGDPKRDFITAPNPYSVVTAPKKTKGPQSCPGAPMENEHAFNRSVCDRRSQNNNSRYENIRGPRTRDDNVMSDRRSDYGSGSTGPSSSERGIRQYRNASAQQHYDVYDSDDEEIYEAKMRIQSLESKIQRMQRRWFEERSVMSQQIERVQEDYYRLKKSHDRVQRSYSHLKTQMETEKVRNADLVKMLQDAHNMIAALETGDESANASSLLCPYGGAELGSGDLKESQGAGEALCFPENSISQPFSLYPPASLLLNRRVEPERDDLAPDEVRVFRTGGSGLTSPMETTREAESPPFDLPISQQDNVVLSQKEHYSRPTRSQSDSDIFSTSFREAPEEDQETMEKYIRKTPWKKALMQSVPEEVSSSDDEVVSLIERQLKKRGELVKFNPPRRALNANSSGKYYKRFGKSEQSALAEFEYLQDLPTDVSGLMSSPEVNQTFSKASTISCNL